MAFDSPPNLSELPEAVSRLLSLLEEDIFNEKVALCVILRPKKLV